MATASTCSARSSRTIIAPAGSSPIRPIQVAGTPSRRTPIATFDSDPPMPNDIGSPLRGTPAADWTSRPIVSPVVTSPTA